MGERHATDGGAGNRGAVGGRAGCRSIYRAVRTVGTDNMQQAVSRVEIQPITDTRSNGNRQVRTIGLGNAASCYNRVRFGVIDGVQRTGAAQGIQHGRSRRLKINGDQVFTIAQTGDLHRGANRFRCSTQERHQLVAAGDHEGVTDFLIGREGGGDSQV